MLLLSSAPPPFPYITPKHQSALLYNSLYPKEEEGNLILPCDGEPKSSQIQKADVGSISEFPKDKFYEVCMCPKMSERSLLANYLS